MPRKVAVLSVARSDYGILRPVLRDLNARETIDVDLIVTGMHLDPRFGNTVDEIRADDQPIAFTVDTGRIADDPTDITASMGREIEGLSSVFAQSRPDILVILGDRFEMLAGAVAALPFNIAIAHIHGGEASFGAIDDAMRHAITKLSHLHFPATQAYADRIRQMGEEADRITVGGAPGLDNILTLDRPSPEEVAARFGFEYDPAQRPLMITYHPETRSEVSASAQIDQVLSALQTCPLPQLFTAPNADAGGLEITRRIEAYCDQKEGAFLVDNLGTANYFAMLSAAAAMVGNSSSGIIEAASFGLPVVNIGDRQKGRACGDNVLHVPLQGPAIAQAVETATSQTFCDGLADLENMYGDGKAACRIGDRIETVKLTPSFMAKPFVDL